MLFRTFGAGFLFAAVACASGGAVQTATSPAPQQTLPPGHYPLAMTGGTPTNKPQFLQVTVAGMA